MDIITILNKYYNDFLNQKIDACHIGDHIIDTGYALEGIELFIDYIKEKEVEEGNDN